MSTAIQSIKTRFGIVGHAPKLTTAIEIARQVAPTEVSVLIVGENGSGKDVFSRIIHQFSKRKHKPFIAINCGAIPEGTMDSELFGHEKGSFTSAIEQRKGYFEEVNGGTIFLDEIGEMPLATQARLLRLLENGEYLRVGSSKIKTADVRIIAATNQNLVEMIRQGKFREDLYFRLNTVTIQVPPLRERGDDIELLFRFFATEFSEKYHRNPLILSPEAESLILQYRWPGNIRELRNFVEKLSVLVDTDLVTETILRNHLEIRESYLPTLAGNLRTSESQAETRREIEFLYKLILDLREEVGEMKKLLYMGMQGVREPDHLYEPLPQTEETPIYREGAYTIEQYRKPETPILEEVVHTERENTLSLEENEKELIRRALKKFNHNRKKAAQELKISERTLYRKIKQYDLN